jgi:antitoxin component of RelBE/YafQ-DinJ toxin-antitoxin module
MKTKLTVTIDENVLPAAKRHAKLRGVSLSRLIETALREMSSTDRLSFSGKWRGKFRASRRSDERLKALAAKYL